MGRTVNKDDVLLDAIRVARVREREAVQIARKELQSMIDKATSHAHAEVIATIRSAVIGGQSARQIGVAYGSSDPHTIRRLIDEASADLNTANSSNHPDWILTKLSNLTFEIQAISLGNTGLSGKAIFKIDDDQENFTAIDGDTWIQVQLYKLGYNEKVIEEFYNDK